MAARYSRQHILEKLEFWNRELAKLDESKQIRYVLKKVVEGSENPDVKVLQSEHDVFFHNKKTGMGFFAHFD